MMVPYTLFAFLCAPHICELKKRMYYCCRYFGGSIFCARRGTDAVVLSNRAFRTGVFAAERELVISNPVLYQLSLLFAQLHSGNKTAVDSAPFANTLELDNSVQQDGQEFMKLLLSLLERELGTSQNVRARYVVQNVFRGTSSYVVT